jgi:two-component system, NtrC family, response regulator AtoC
VNTFLRQFNHRFGRNVSGIAPDALAALTAYDFPGNVRELENLLKRIVVLESEEPVVRDLLAADAPASGRQEALDRLLEEVERSAGDLPLREVGRLASLEAERSAIERTLLRTQWNRKQAARLLGVSYKTLLQKIRECGLEAS